MTSAFLGAIINFIINMILIPRYASLGACIGTIVAEFVVMFYQSFVVRKDLEIKYYIKNSIIFLIKSIIMFVMVILVGTFIENQLLKILVQVSTGGILYAIMNFNYIINNIGIKKLYKLRKENI